MSKRNGPIRRWLDKMGLISSPPSEEQIPTAELPRPPQASEPEPEPESEYLTQQELAISTADTQPLPAEIDVSKITHEPKADEQEVAAPVMQNEPKVDNQEMHNKVAETENKPFEMNDSGSGPLLDLGEFEPAHAAAEEDFVLELDLDDAPAGSTVAATPSTHAFADAGSEGTTNVDEGVQMGQTFTRANLEGAEQGSSDALVEPTVDPMAETQEMMRPTFDLPASVSERRFTEPEIVASEPLRMTEPEAKPATITFEQLSPEAIDAIARRAVEMLSEKVVQEIAWEVVPQLAELMIKRQLEEKSS